MLTVVYAVAVLVAVGANQGFAQEEGSGVDHTPYWYVVSHEVCPTKNHEYSLTMYRIVEALKRHENANNWMGYRTTTGGPEVRYFYFVGMENAGDFEDWTEPHQALVETVGVEEAAGLMEALGELTEAKVEIWKVDEDSSHLDPSPQTAPPKRAMELRIDIPPGRAPEFDRIMQKYVAAYESQDEAGYWSTSRCIVGAKGLEYSMWVSFDDFADLDARPDLHAVITSEYGEEEAAAIGKDFAQLAMIKTRFLTYVSWLSNPAVDE